MKRLYIPISVMLSLVLIPLFTACMVKMEIEGDYVAPDSLKMTMTADLNGEKSPEIEFVKIGETAYAKDPESQQWMMADEVESYQEFSELEDFVTAFIQLTNAFEGTSLLSDEEINGALCYHVKGTIDSTKLEDTSSEFPSTGTGSMSAQLWIGKEDFLVRRMVLEVKAEDSSSGTATPISGGRMSFTYEFSRYNEPIVIEAPQLASN
jgi:hypothetical protein